MVEHPEGLRDRVDVQHAVGAAFVPQLRTPAEQALAGDAGRTRAALASEVAATVYGLTILSRDMHDRPDNATTFAVVARPEGNPQ